MLETSKVQVDSEHIAIKKAEIFNIFIEDIDKFIQKQARTISEDYRYAKALESSLNSELNYNDKNDDYHSYILEEASKFYQFSKQRSSLLDKILCIIGESRDVEFINSKYDELSNCLYDIYLLNCNQYLL